MSCSRTVLCSRSPTTCSSWSPAAWPSLSLTCLKPSMSMYSAPATRAGGCAPRERASARRGRAPARGWAGRSACRAAPGARARGSSRARATARARGRCEHQHEQPEQHAQQDPADEQRRARASRGTRLSATPRAEALHRPAVVQSRSRRSALRAGSVPLVNVDARCGRRRSGRSRPGSGDPPAPAAAPRPGRAARRASRRTPALRAASVDGHDAAAVDRRLDSRAVQAALDERARSWSGRLSRASISVGASAQ